MVAIKAHSATAFLAKPDANLRAILLFGPDAGLVSERAAKLAQVLAARENPPGEIVRIDDADLESDPGRLTVELLTVPMFGGAKIVRTTQSRRISADLIRPLLEGPPLPGALIVEAGNLKNTDAMRVLFERQPAAAAIAGYADEDGNLDQLAREVLGAAGLAIAPEALQELRSRLGADRGLSRAEIEKLALYATAAGTVGIEHVEAIVGDASELAVDRILDAAASGDAATALGELDRIVASGDSAQLVISAAQRHFLRLHRSRVALDAGRSVDDIVRGMRPALYFKARPAFEHQLRRWTLPQLGAVLTVIATVARQARLAGALEDTIAERLLIDIARRAGRPAGRARNH